jgi:CheY-like chemotaxis protein
MRSRILIVDDDPRFRSLARRLMEAWGYVVAAEAADGAQALAAAGRACPDAALIDVQLPDIDHRCSAADLGPPSDQLTDARTLVARISLASAYA